MNNEVILLASFTAKSGQADKLKAKLSRLIEPTRKEEGCIIYNLHTQNDDENSFCFYEIWKDQDSLDRHSSTPFFKEVMGQIQDLIEKPAKVVYLNKQ